MEIISVVMITYNHQNYIEQAIKSVFAQKTTFLIDFIIANDYSTDDSDSIIKKIISTCPENINVNYKYQQENLGMMPNFIWALKQAKGKYIAICDGDDYWLDPLKLSKQFTFLETNDAFSFCFHPADNYLEKENKFIKIVDLDKHKDLTEANKKILFKRLGGSFPTSAAFFRTNMLKPFPEYFSHFNVTDSPLILTALSHGKVGFLKEKMSVYRTVPANWSAQNNIFENKWNNYIHKIKTIDYFDNYTNKVYNKELKLSKNNLNYQILFSYFKQNPQKIKRIRFLLSNSKYLNLKNKVKIFIRLIQK